MGDQKHVLGLRLGEAEKNFRRIQGYRDLGMLKAALDENNLKERGGRVG